MLKEEDYIRFTAALPSIQSAIQISGLGDGARVKFKVPQSEMVAVLKLQSLSGQYSLLSMENMGLPG